MCRLFGMSAGQSHARATFWLLAAPDSLVVQSRREPDGAGLGWFDEHREPQLYKRPIAAYQDAEFARVAKTVSSRTFIAHVRFASGSALSMENTHPFEQAGRLFAHNGVIEDLPKLEARLGAGIELVQGQSDSERYFALVTGEIAAHDGDVGAGLRAAARWIAEELPVFAINCVLATPDGLWALRYPETHALYLLEHDTGETLRHESSYGSRIESQHGRSHRLVVLASERMDDDPDWRPIPSGQLVHIDAEMRVEREQILDAPPAQLLSLKDLSAQAQASQSHPPAQGAAR